MRDPLASTKAFTLVELLVVIAILAMVAAFIVPAMVGFLNSMNLTQGANIVMDQLANARQTASSQNCSVQVRLIQKSGLNGGYNAIQLWVSGTNGTMAPVSKVVTLPVATAISQDPTNLSGLLQYLPSPTSQTMPRGGPAAGDPYTYFSIRPSGEVVPIVTGSNRSNLFLSVVSSHQAASTTPPANYASIQLNPDTGSVLLYRP